MRTAWETTRALSPRPRVRVAAVDAYGRITNDFPGSARLSASDPPASTWAMHLTDSAGQYRYLTFDLDAKGGRPDVDAGRLTVWLYDLGIPYLVAESGPAGGRHVWISLSEAIEPATVHWIADQAKRLLPSLDLSPLKNATTGAVRPPGAPHRHGGYSTVLEGSLQQLQHPTVDRDDVDRLYQYLLELAGPLPAPLAPRRVAFVELDDAGSPYIAAAGTRISKVRFRAPGTDASALLASALARCAQAGMRFEDVLAIAPSSAAFTHAYSARGANDERVPRRPQEAQKILRRQWERSVQWVAETPKAHTAQDPDFARRAMATVQLVDALQERAAASPGRWARHGAGPAQSAGSGRYSDRLILDALCLLSLQAVNGAVEASDRSLSALVPVGRETARQALLRLAEDGWIALEAEAAGNRASKWRLRDFSTGSGGSEWSQVSPPPSAPSGALLRKHRIQELSDRLQLQNHDVFAAPGSLGRAAGRVYAAVTAHELTAVSEISRASQVSPVQARRALRSLARYQLLEQAAGYWQRAADNRDQAALQLHVDGYLGDRRRRYLAEREAWAWWQAELEHRRAPRGRRRRRRHATQFALVRVPGASPDYPIHPRKPDGRADFAAARRIALEGILVEELHDQVQVARAA